MPGLRTVRVSQPNQEPVHYIQRSSLCLAAQGAKIAMIGSDTYAYEAGQMALYSVDVPMAGRVTRASYSEPYLLFMIDLDAEKIAELTRKCFRTACRNRETRAHCTSRMPMRRSSMRARACSN